MALAPLTTKAWFCAHGECCCPGIREAHVYVMSQAAVAIRERVLRNENLPEFHDSMSPELNARSHKASLCGLPQNRLRRLPAQLTPARGVVIMSQEPGLIQGDGPARPTCA
jgi:hypothetical protein